jgi:hypothetical protein
MKQCIKCLEQKDDNNFYKQKRKIKENYIDNVCKICRQKESKDNRNQTKEWLNDLRKPCIVCNESRSHLIDFHHLDPSKKDINVSKYSSSGGAKFETKKIKLIEEINKCVCLCSNCHRDFHFYEKEKQMNFEEYLKFITK